MELKDFLKDFSRKTVLTYARQRQPREYLGALLFPEEKVGELSFEYFKTANRLPVAANVQAFGAEAQIASREGVSKIKGEIPPVKRKINLDERYLIYLKKEGAGDVDLVKNQVFNDLDNLIEAIHACVEKMRMDALTTGKIVLNENGIVLTVDYGVPSNHKEVLANTDTADGFWDKASAEPITMLQEWKQALIDDTGIAPERGVTSTKVIMKLLNNKQIRQMIYGDLGATRAITQAQLNDLLRSLDLPELAAYDLKIRKQAENGAYTTQRLFPDNMVVLLPGTALGDTLMGPTGEALVDADVQASEVAGIYASVAAEEEPPGLWTKVAATAIPTFPMADCVYQAQVLA